MATRLYLSSNTIGANPSSPSGADASAFSATSSQFGQYYLESTADSSFSTKSANESITSGSLCVGQWWSHPMTSVHTWDYSTAQPSITWVQRFKESVNSANLYYKVNFRIMSGDGATEHDDAGGGYVGGVEFSTTLNSKRISGVTNAFGGYTNAVGDRFVLEVGIYRASTSTRTWSCEIGGNSGTDLPDANGNTNQYNPWVELSHDITFDTEGGATGPFNQLMLIGIGS